MFTMFSDMTDTMRMFDDLERQMHRSFARDPRAGELRDVTLRDQGDAFVLTAELPGVADKDVDITLEGDVLTLKAERTRDVPKGLRLVRNERRDARWLKQVAMPCRVVPDAVTAKLELGVLTVHLPKAAEAKPKKITIGAPETPKA